MDIFWVGILGILLTATLTFYFKPDRSRYEIDRLARGNAKYKTLANFLEIYRGILIFTRLEALIVALILTIFVAKVWGIWAGGGLAFLIIVASFFLAQAFHGLSHDFISKHLDFFNKYFAWTRPLGQIIPLAREPEISSEYELLHLIENGDFLDDSTKSLIQKSLDFRGKTVEKIMTPRDDLVFVHSRDNLTPILIDELFASGHRLFPVARGNIDQIVGFLLLDDVLPIDQEEKDLKKIMRKNPPAIDIKTPLESALRQMCEFRVSALIVVDGEKTAGMITLHDIVRELFSNEAGKN